MDTSLRSILASIAIFGLLCVQAPAQILSQIMMSAPAAAITITLATSNGAFCSTGCGNTKSVTLTGGNTGDLIVCSAYAQNNVSVQATSISDGTSSLTALGVASITGTSKYWGQMFYLLSANGPGKTYTATFGAAGDSPEIECFDFHANSGSWHYDTSNQACGNNTSADTGAITTSSTNEIVVFTGKLFQVAATTSNPLINGVTPTEPGWSPLSTYDHQYYRILSSTFSSGHGTKTYSTTTYWCAHLGAFYAL